MFMISASELRLIGEELLEVERLAPVVLVLLAKGNAMRDSRLSGCSRRGAVLEPLPRHGLLEFGGGVVIVLASAP